MCDERIFRENGKLPEKLQFQCGSSRFPTRESGSVVGRALETAVVAAARLSRFRVIVDVRIVAVQARRRLAVKLIPPHAHQRLLAEDRSVRAQKVESAVQRANVEHLALGLDVGIVAGERLRFAIERRLRDFRVNGVVGAGHAWNGRIVAVAAAVVVVRSAELSGLAGAKLAALIVGAIIRCAKAGGSAESGRARRCSEAGRRGR